MEIIVTDLTRFSNESLVCIAGIDMKTNQCIRPLPYLKKSKCAELNLLPGAILLGHFSKSEAIERPHTEDMKYANLSFKGPCTSEEFESALSVSSYPSINTGFEDKVPINAKVIPPEKPPSRSIITLQLNPDQIEIVRSKYDAKSLRLNVKDNDGRSYKFLSISDLGFYNLALSKQEDPFYTHRLNEYIKGQKKLYLRLGLSRAYNSEDGRNGFWIQVNGIYTFPEFMTEVRPY